MATVLHTAWQALATAFEQMAGQDGYVTTVRTVTTDPAMLETLPSPLTPACVVLYDEARSDTEADAMSGQDLYRMVFRTLWRIDAPGLDAASRIAAYANLRADVRKAIAADSTCGGVAFDCRLTGGSGPEMEGGRILAWWDVTVWATVEDEVS